MADNGFPVTKVVVPAHTIQDFSGPISKSRLIPERRLYSGDVFRGLRNDSGHQALHQAFSSTVVLGFSHPNEHGDVYARVARPYAYAAGVGSVCPSVLLGCEEYTVRVQDITDHWTLIDTGRISGGFDTIEVHDV